MEPRHPLCAQATRAAVAPDVPHSSSSRREPQPTNGTKQARRLGVDESPSCGMGAAFFIGRCLAHPRPARLSPSPRTYAGAGKKAQKTCKIAGVGQLWPACWRNPPLEECPFLLYLFPSPSSGRSRPVRVYALACARSEPWCARRKCSHSFQGRSV